MELDRWYQNIYFLLNRVAAFLDGTPIPGTPAISTYAQTLLDDTTAAAARATLLINGHRSSDYASLSAAITAIGSTSCTLIIDTNQTVSTNVTIPSTCSVIVQKGAIITVASSKTLTITGPLYAGDYQIFSGTGAVSGLKRINAKWFGAVGNYNGLDGTGADDTTALQAAFTTWDAETELIIPAGYYKITSPITRGSNSSLIKYAKLTFEPGAHIVAKDCGGLYLTGIWRSELRGINIHRSAVDWTTDDSGLKITGDFYQNQVVEIGVINNFNKNLHFVATAANGVIWNNIKFNVLQNGKYQIYTEQASGSAAFNSNHFSGGEMGLSSSYYNTDHAGARESWGIYRGYDGYSNSYTNMVIESVCNGIYLDDSYSLLSNIYMESVDANKYAGTLSKSTIILGNAGYASASIRNSYAGRGNVFLGNDSVSSMSIITEAGNGIGWSDPGGKQVVASIAYPYGSNRMALTMPWGTTYLDKHYSGSGVPTVGTYRIGAIVWNSAVTAGQPLGWICSGAGTAGTLSGVTATATASAYTAVVNDSTNLHIGDYIEIAGAGTGGATLSSSIDYVDGTTIRLGSQVKTSVTDAAVAYTAPTFLNILGQVSYRSGAGSPSGSVTPTYIGEEYYDTTGHWYKSNGTTNTSWLQLN